MERCLYSPLGQKCHISEIYGNIQAKKRTIELASDLKEDTRLGVLAQLNGQIVILEADLKRAKYNKCITCPYGS